MSRYRFIAAERGHYPVRRLCQVLGVPPSGFYVWQQGQQRAVGSESPAGEKALVKTFGHHQRRYGTRRLRVTLREKGHRVSRQRLRTAMRHRGLRALQPKAFAPRTTDSIHGLRCAPNRLLDQPTPTRASRVWVSNITYLPLANGAWAYLCAFQDVASKHVVSWHVMATMPEELVATTLPRAFFGPTTCPGPGRALRPRGAIRRQCLPRPLVPARGRACAEPPGRVLRQRPGWKPTKGFGRRWSRLKTKVLELREWHVFADLADAQASIADYFDYYNHDRLHSITGYQTPYHTHQQLLQSMS